MPQLDQGTCGVSRTDQVAIRSTGSSSGQKRETSRCPFGSDLRWPAAQLTKVDGRGAKSSAEFQYALHFDGPSRQNAITFLVSPDRAGRHANEFGQKKTGNEMVRKIRACRKMYLMTFKEPEHRTSQQGGQLI